MNKSLSLSLLCISSLIFSANEGTCETCDSKYSGGWGIMRSMCRASRDIERFKRDNREKLEEYSNTANKVTVVTVVAGVAVVGVAVAAPYVAPVVSAIAANSSAAAIGAYNALNAAISSAPTATKLAITGAANAVGVSEQVMDALGNKKSSTSEKSQAVAGLFVAGGIMATGEKSLSIGIDKIKDIASGGPTAREKERRIQEEKEKQRVKERAEEIWYAEQNLKANNKNVKIQERALNLHEEMLKSEQNEKLNEKQKELAEAKREIALQTEQNAKLRDRLGDKSINYRRSGDNELKRSMRIIQGLDEKKE